MKTILAFALLAVVAAPAVARPIDPDALKAESEAIAEKFDNARIAVATDRLNRPVCSVDQSSGDALIDDRMCRFALDCMHDHRDDQAAADACVTARTSKVIEKFARRNISKRDRK